MDEVAQSLEANTADKYVQFEYEAQHFGFTPITLMNGMYNSVCDLYRDALKAYCTKLMEKYPDVMSEEEITAARHVVGHKVDQHICEIFDKLEIFLLDNVFTIPDECVLPKDMCQLTQWSPEEKEAMDNKKIELRKRIIAVKYANALLRKQLESGEAFSDCLKENLDILKKSFDVGGGNNTKDYLSYFSDSILTAFKNQKT